MIHSRVVIRLQGCLPSVLAEALERQPLMPAKAAFAWRQAVGPAMARVTEVSIGGPGTLTVRLADEHWSREVRRMQPLILTRLEPLLGKGVIKALAIRVKS